MACKVQEMDAAASQAAAFVDGLVRRHRRGLSISDEDKRAGVAAAGIVERARSLRRLPEHLWHVGCSGCTEREAL